MWAQQEYYNGQDAGASFDRRRCVNLLLAILSPTAAHKVARGEGVLAEPPATL